MEKICTKCKTSKPLEEFFRLRQARDGHAQPCKLCRRLETNRLMNEGAERLRKRYVPTVDEPVDTVRRKQGNLSPKK
jgi:hypothetical protein